MNTYGLEFEVQGVNPFTASHALRNRGIECTTDAPTHGDPIPTWKAVYDGSCPNGAEVVSPILNRSTLNESAKVAKVLKSAGAYVDTKTGLHVHVGLNAFESDTRSVQDNLANFVLNYYAIHHAIGALVSRSRLNNRYTRVLSRRFAEIEAEGLRGGHLGSSLGRSSIASLNINHPRYCSVNLCSIDRHGTVEFRLHQGTLNGVKAIAWVNFIEALIADTNAGADYTADLYSIGAWGAMFGNRATASVIDCKTLLDRLTATGALESSTADWLKNRAGKLNS